VTPPGVLPLHRIALHTLVQIMPGTADPRMWRRVNDLARGTFNCVGTAFAVDLVLSGRRAFAINHELANVALIEWYFGRRFGGVTGLYTIGLELQAAGPGARAILLARSRSKSIGHAFNAVNIRGTIHFLDGQSGDILTRREVWEAFDSFQFLRTR